VQLLVTDWTDRWHTNLPSFATESRKTTINVIMLHIHHRHTTYDIVTFTTITETLQPKINIFKVLVIK